MESEYQINPKPDKLARTHIVNRVSLGEKEVQVRDAKTWSVHNLPAVRVADILLVLVTDLVPKSPPERPEEIEASPAARAACTALKYVGLVGPPSK